MNPNNIYRYWLVFFYYYALNGYSVMQALDLASQATGYANYGTSILGTGGYWVYWPYPPNGPRSDTGRMHVAGDPFGTYIPGNIFL